LGLVVVAVAMSGCAKTKAAANAEAPPLNVPAPPPRVLAPAEEPLAATPEPETPVAPAPRAPARNTPPRRNTGGQPAAEPERPEAQPPTPAPQPPAAEPSKDVHPVPAPADPNEERKVRAVLTRASRDLNRIDYQKLTADGRSQYEQSKRFTEQAEQALKEHNYVFAATLADKAAALATELRGQ
jgi:hypothetical protein